MRSLLNFLSRPREAAGAAFALGVVLAVLAALGQARFNHAEAARHFEELSRRGADQVAAQMHRYEYGTRGVRGAVLAAGRQLTREHFRQYSASRDLDHEFPGARGFGVMQRVKPEEEAAFVAAARLDGAPNFRVRQIEPNAGERYLVQYVEPSDLNANAIGLDAASEPNRRQAAERSARTGDAVLTAPITLVQATGHPESAFLLLLAIYPNGMPPATVAEREASVIGWAFAPLLIDDVLSNIDLSSGKFTFSLRDMGTHEAHTFFASPGNEKPAADGLTWQTDIPVYGRTWRIETRATPAFVADLQQADPRHLALASATIAMLLSMLAYEYAQGTARAKLVLNQQARHSAILESSADAIVGESLDGIITDWNQGAERLFGYPASMALGQSAEQLLVPTVMVGEHTNLLWTVGQGKGVGPFDTTRRRRDGSLIEVSIVASPILDANGCCIGLSTSLRDITDSRLMQSALLDLNSSLERQVAERTASLDAALHDLRAIMDAVPSMIGYWDTGLVNRVANRAYGDWLGMAPEELRGKHMSDALGVVAFARNRYHAQAALRGERQTFEHSAPRSDGSGVGHWQVHYLPDVLNGQVKGFHVLLNDVSELTESRLRLATAQRDNNALLNTLHHHASVLVTDPQGKILEVNDNFCLISGYQRDELLGVNPRIVKSEVQDDAFWAEMWRTITSGLPWRNEACNRRKDGSLYWMDCTVSPFFGDDGRIEKFVSIRTDITQRKRAEEALHLTNVRFDIASGSAGIGVWEHDVAAGRMIWDARMFQLYGECGEVDRHPYRLWRKALHRDDRARVQEALRQARHGEGELDIEFRIVTPGGEVRHLRAAARTVRDPQGRMLRMTGVNFDITKRMRAELELRETSTLLKTVLDSASEFAIIATDTSLHTTIYNTGAERLLGYCAEELMGRVTPTLIHDAQEIEARSRELSGLLDRAIGADQVFIDPSVLGMPQEWTYVRKDGGRVPVSLVVTPMHDHTGALSGYLGIAHDVSRQKQQEHSLREAVANAIQANGAKSQFLANMSHEIRTPLNAILGMLTLVQRTPLDARQLDYVSKTEAAAQSLLGLLNDILDFSKVEAGKMELDPRPFQLDKVLRNLAVILSTNVGSKPVQVLFDIDPQVPRHLVGDDLRLQQVLINLGGNAVKFTTEGQVVVGVRPLGEAIDGRMALQFSVRDTGIGISPENQERIFSGFTQAEATTTRRFGGTGLGLAICRRLVALMGGELTLSSAPGAGTTFFFTLNFPFPCSGAGASPTDLALAWMVPGQPLSPSAPISAATLLGPVDPARCTGLPSPMARLPRLKGLRLLLVEDNLNNQQIAVELLEAEGAMVHLACNGTEAVTAVAASGATAPVFDAVLMDLQMPEMDGLEATARIRQWLGQTTLPIIAMTANALSSERDACLAAGMDDHVGKPFDLDHLIEVLLRHTGHVAQAQAEAQAQIVARAGRPLPGALLAEAERRQIDLVAALRRVGGNEGAYLRMLRSFLKEAPGVPDELARRVAESAWIDASRLMHTMKGLAGTLGARALQDVTGRAETDLTRKADAGPRGDAQPWLQGIRQVFEQACTDLGWLAGQLQAAQPAPPRKEAHGDRPAAVDVDALREQLARLASLLGDGDMAALDVQAQIEAQHGDLLGDGLRALDEAMSVLDFEQALTCCRALSRQLDDGGRT